MPQHKVQVTLVYGTGNPDDGYHSDPEQAWGRARRPFYVPSCWCEWEGRMHEDAADARREAHEHAPDVEPEIWAHGGERIPFPA